MAANYYCVNVVPILVIWRDSSFCRFPVLVEENGFDSRSYNPTLHFANSKFYAPEFAKIANVGER